MLLSTNSYESCEFCSLRTNNYSQHYGIHICSFACLDEYDMLYQDRMREELDDEDCSGQNADYDS